MFRSPKVKLVLTLVLLVVIAGVIQINRQLPVIQVKPVSQSVEIPGSFSVTFPDQGESAVGTDNFGVVAASADQTAVPIASLAKMMTAYLVLKEHPLQPGQDGPSLTINAQDVADYQADSNNGYSVLKVAQGETLTEKQLLEGLLLPSGDNVASTLARWISGSESAFVAKMNETAKSLGMNDTHYADASGVSEETVSSAVDQLKIAQAAMQDPAFQKIVAMPQATLPVAGTVYNVDSMLGKHGIVGIKTGSTSAAGGCFVSTTPVVAENETHFIIAAVLGQQSLYSLQQALDANARILDQVRSEFTMYQLAPPAAGFGQLVSGWQTTSDLKVAQPVRIFGYPGMKIALSIQNLKTQLPVSTGENVATLRIEAGQKALTVPLQSAGRIDPPSFLWRLFR